MNPKGLSRRNFLYLSAAVAGTGLLAACAPAAAPASAPDAEGGAPSGAANEIRFASFDWFAMVPGQKWDEYNTAEAIPEFQKEHPGMEVVWEPHGDGWEQKVLTQMAAGTAPDVMSTWPPVINTWAEKQQLLDLQPLVDVDLPNANEIFIKSQWDQMIDPFTGIRLGMCTGVDVTSVYYSKPAFEEAGVALPTADWTTQDYAAAAEALTVRDATGNTTRWGAQLRPEFTLGYSYYVEAFGGATRDDETRMTCLLGEAQAQEALEWIRANMWDANVFAQSNQVDATGIPNTWTGVLPAGVVAFAERSADQFFALADALPEGSWDIAHLPRGPQDQAAMGAPDCWAVYKGVVDRGNQDAVWQFVKWLGAGDYYQTNIATKAGRIPTYLPATEQWPTILRSLDARLEPISLEVILEQLESGEARGPELFRFQAVADELLQPAMEAIFVEGSAPVSSLQAIAQQITDAQQAALNRATGG